MENENEEVRDPAALLAAYNKIKADLASRVDEVKSLAAEIDTLKSSPNEWKSKAINSEVRNYLQAQVGGDVDRVIKFIDLEGVDFGEDGSLTGLSEKVDSLKADLPEVFDPKKRVGGKADIHADNPPKKEDNPILAAVRAAKAS